VTALMGKLAGAPISWGVCEVPGWGYQLSVDRVLREMLDIDLVATEFGPDGFLPDDPNQRANTLATYGLRAVGGFVPVVAHDPHHDPLPAVDTVLDGFVAADAGVLVLAAVTGQDGYDQRPALTDDEWKTLFANLERITAHASGRGIQACLHPHVGTVVETRDDVYRLLEGSTVPLCLDTGHLLVGGTDPATVVREVPGRVVHTHLKDVDERLARRVRTGEVTYTEAVRGGMYRPLGQGDVDIAGIVRTLQADGYTGWYVMEQDTVLDAEPTGPGPVEDVAASVAYLRSLT
jgi:inosose dehydratase